jgi:hypothetical protein
MDILVYLAGPISATATRSVEDHVQVAVDHFLRLSAAGIPAFCPHLTANYQAACDIPYEQWMCLDVAVIRRCTHLALLPGWEASPGATRERQHALEHGKTITTVEALIAAYGPRPSAQPCGCDAGAGWMCETHRLPPSGFRPYAPMRFHVSRQR